MDLGVVWPLWPLGCAVPAGHWGSCPSAGTLCQGVLALGAEGPGCPQEVLASVLGQHGWEGPQNSVKEREKGVSQVIFGMTQVVSSSSP